MGALIYGETSLPHELYTSLMDDDSVQVDEDADGVPAWLDETTITRRPFRATPTYPIPTMQCTGEVRSGPRAGEQCSKQAIRGASVCPQHGGQLPVVKRAAERIVEEARVQLMFNASRAPDILLDLAENSASDAVRLGAANSLLDRSGIKGGQDLNVTVQQGESPAQVLSDRLTKLRERVVEGEVVHSSESTGDSVDLEEDPLHRSEE